MNNSFEELINQFSNNPDVDILKKIYKINVERNNSFNDFHEGLQNISLLHIKQPYETMKYLLDRGGNPNLVNNSGVRPIHFQKEFKTIQLLVDRMAIPNPKDIYGFSPLYWQKDPESVKYLLRYNPIENNFVYNHEYWGVGHYYNKMLIEGGYDPYSEKNISITPVFVQKDLKSLDILLDYCYVNGINNMDIVGETLLFKPCINKDIIELFDENNQDLDHVNILGNTALHVQHEPVNILKLLTCGANPKIENYMGVTPYEYHMNRENRVNCLLINKFVSVKCIQRCWRKFWFAKTYITPKYYKKKIEFMENFKLLPPSICGKFPGGIGYQTAFEGFHSILEIM